MPLSQNEVKKIFELAKLAGSDDFINNATSALEKIFAMVETINKIDTTNIKPLSHPNNAIQILRDDEANPDIPREKLQKSAPSVEYGLYLVPTVIE